MERKYPVKTVYYKDERNDEFSSAVITPKRIDENWEYAPKGVWWRYGTVRVI